MAKPSAHLQMWQVKSPYGARTNYRLSPVVMILEGKAAMSLAGPAESNFFRNYYQKKLPFSPKGNLNLKFCCRKLPANKNKQLYIASSGKKVALPLKKQLYIVSNRKKVALFPEKQLSAPERI